MPSSLNKPPIVSIKDILLYSKCPRKYSYDKTMPIEILPTHNSKCENLDIVWKALSGSIRSKTKIRATVDFSLPRRIESLIFKNAQKSPNFNVITTTDRNLYVRRAMSKINYLVYNDYRSYYHNLNLSYRLDDRLYLQDSIPFVAIEDDQSILSVVDVLNHDSKNKIYTFSDLQNSIFWRLRLLLLNNSLGILPNYIEIYDISYAKTSVQTHQYRLSDLKAVDMDSIGRLPKCKFIKIKLPNNLEFINMLHETSKMAKYIGRGILNKVYFPSFSSQCNSCQFKNSCTWV